MPLEAVLVEKTKSRQTGLKPGIFLCFPTRPSTYPRRKNKIPPDRVLRRQTKHRRQAWQFSPKTAVPREVFSYHRK